MAHWSDDEQGFNTQFDLPYEDFVEALNLLDEEHQKKYETIRKTSQKAAVLWAIHEAKKRGILTE